MLDAETEAIGAVHQHLGVIRAELVASHSSGQSGIFRAKVSPIGTHLARKILVNLSNHAHPVAGPDGHPMMPDVNWN